MRFALFVVLIVLVGCSSSPKQNQLSSEDLARKEQLELLKKHYQVGEGYYQNGQLDLAETEFAEMLRIESEQEHALYRLGTISFKKREFEKSADYFERTIRSNPKNKKAHYNLANIRLMQAENHFKYYAALSDKDADLSKVSKLVADIDDFNTRKAPTSSTRGSLDAIAGALKK